MNEKYDKLEKISKIYDPSSEKYDFDATFKTYHSEIILNNLSGNKILELGCSTGYSTYLLDNGENYIDVVEGSLNNINMSKKKFNYKNVEFVHSLWADYDFKGKYSDILLIDTIQMLDDKSEILTKIKNSMDQKSRFHIISPNNKSFHRLLGLEMNLIENLDDQSARDIAVEANQDLNWDKLRHLLSMVGFNILKEEGILFKLFDNKKMGSLDSDIISALFNLGNEFKENAAHMYICCALEK
jgi:SAM-dependent methyltransferase